MSFLLAEQNTFMALKYARYGYILENGRVVMDGDAKSLRENEDVKEFYLGIAEGKRKSFREGKHYKRRKRWLACTDALQARLMHVIESRDSLTTISEDAAIRDDMRERRLPRNSRSRRAERTIARCRAIARDARRAGRSISPASIRNR